METIFSRIQLSIRLSILLFLLFCVWGSWYVTLGTYLIHSLNFSGEQVGLIYGSVAISATVSPFLLGVLADQKFATEKILVFLHMIGSILLLLVSQMQEFWLFFPLLILYSLLFIPSFSLTNALCFRHLTDIEKQFPWIRLWGTIAWVLVTVLVSFLEWEDQVFPLYMAAGFSLLLGLYAITLPPTPPLPSATGKLSIFSHEILKFIKVKYILVFLLCMIGIRFSTSFYYSFVNPYLNEIGIQYAAAKMSLGQVAEILIMMVIPFLLTRWNIKSILTIGILVWGFRYFLLKWGGHMGWEWLIYVAILLHGVAFCFSTLAAQIYIDRLFPETLRNTAQGLFTMVTMGAGVVVGSWAAGLLVDGLTQQNVRQWNLIWDIPAWWGIFVALIFYLFFHPKSLSSEKGISHK